MEPRRPVTIAIPIGDPTGVGPEVSLKAVAARDAADDTRYVLVGDPLLLDQLNRALDLRLALPTHAPAEATQRLSVLACPAVRLTDHGRPGNPEAARAAIAWLETAARQCLQSSMDAVCTAPLSKEAVIRSGLESFVGQTEHLTQLAGGPRTAMMLLGHDDRQRWLRVALATTHVPMRQLPDAVTAEAVTTAIDLAVQACRDLCLPRARIAVCGLNPHAGEGGKMGREEITTIGPAIRAAQERGLDVVGPLAGDTVFHAAAHGSFDAVVAMYHDQGLAPLKLLAFDTGVNWTLGLPFVRTSPDHGTAYDIAGKGVANPSSMISALRLARELAARKTAPC